MRFRWEPVLDVTTAESSRSDPRQGLLHGLVNGPFVDPAAYATVGLDGGRVLVVPRRQRAVQRAALLDYPGLQSPKERLARRALLAGLSAPAAPWLPAPDVGSAVDGGGRLWQLITEAIDTEVVWCAAVLRTPGPHWTPIIHLFDGESKRVGVAKLALNPVTTRNVTAEADALADLGGSRDGLFIPRLLGRASMSPGAFVAVVEPLPGDVRSSVTGAPVDDGVVESIVHAGGGVSYPGHDGAYLVELRQFVGSLALDSPTAARCAELLGRQVPTARCHGDLVPWNVGLVPGSAVLWDFEYSAADAPAGFDAVQGRYRLARESGTEIREALIAAAHNAEPVLRRLGLDAAERAMVGALHALDAARRIHDGVDARGTEPSDFTVAVAAALDIGAKRG